MMTTAVPSPSTLFELLPPTIQAEVKRVVIKFTLIILGFVLLFTVLLGLAISPNLNQYAVRLAVAIGAALMGLMLFIVLPLPLLAFGFGAWPAFLGKATLRELYGITPQDLNSASFRALMKTTAYWAHGLAGLILGCGSAALGILIWYSITGKTGGPIGAVFSSGLIGYYVNLKAWLIRRLVAERLDRVACFPWTCSDLSNPAARGESS